MSSSSFSRAGGGSKDDGGGGRKYPNGPPQGPSKKSDGGSKDSGKGNGKKKANDDKASPSSSSSSNPVGTRAGTSQSGESSSSSSSRQPNGPPQDPSRRAGGDSKGSGRGDGEKPSGGNESSSSSSNPNGSGARTSKSGLGSSKSGLRSSSQAPGGGSNEDGNGGESGGDLPFLGTITDREEMPQEVIDNIYDHLFNNEDLRPPREGEQGRVHSRNYQKHYGRAHTYRFHLEVLGLNHKCRANARQHLHQRNKFMLVTFKVARFHQYLHLCDIPIISDHPRLDCFNMHTVALRLTWNGPPAAVGVQSQEDDVLDDHDKGKILMLLEDLPELCWMLKFMCQYAPYDGVYVMTDRDVPLRLLDLPTRQAPLNMSVDIVRQPEAVHKQIEQQQFVLDAIKVVTGGGYNLKLNGLRNDSGVSADMLRCRLQKQMAPRLIWISALAWDQLETAATMKFHVDQQLAIDGDLIGAMKRIQQINDHAITIRRTLKQMCLPPQPTDQNWCRDVAESRFRYLLFDIKMSIVQFFLLVESSDVIVAFRHLSAIDHIRAASWFTPLMDLQQRHLYMLCVLYGHIAGLFATTNCHEVVQGFLGVRDEYAKPIEHDGWTEYREPDSYVERDAGVLIEAFGREGAETHTLEEEPSIASILPRLSPQQLGFRRFDTLSQTGLPTRPSGLQNWQDIYHLPQFSSDERNQVLQMLGSRKPPLSDIVLQAQRL